MALKLDTEALRYIAALENVSGAEVKDCIVNENIIIYVVKKGNLGTAIGKKGSNVQKLTTKLGKKIHLVEFSPDPVEFTNKLLGTTITKNVVLQEEGKKQIIIEVDFKNRGIILGKGGKNIKIIKDLLKRHHDIEDVVVK